ncbi:MAG: osmoprotectant transport system permease protein [Thermomicrobiales bacterium]|nr:osmoprotectant transport system permease protein [Thermomicrobiales bacterium]
MTAERRPGTVLALADGDQGPDRGAMRWRSMDLLGDSLRYIQDNPERFREALAVHIRLSFYAVLAAVAIFFPLGVFASRSRRVGPAVIGLVSAARVVPSISVLFVLYPYRREIGDLLPFWDRSFVLALIALILLAGPPLIINTDAGLRSVGSSVLENARGLGMNEFQVFARVQLPLALPVVVAGLRTAAVEVVASATLAAFVGAGGLGRFITSGLTLLDYSLLFVGAIPVALLALFAEASLAGMERLVTPPA